MISKKLKKFLVKGIMAKVKNINISIGNGDNTAEDFILDEIGTILYMWGKFVAYFVIAIKI